MATEPEHGTAAGDEPMEDSLETDLSLDDDDGPTDVQLTKLDERLNTALGDLMEQNKQVESYLDFLAEERRRAMRGTDADQLTIEDAVADAAGTSPTDLPTAAQ